MGLALVAVCGVLMLLPAVSIRVFGEQFAAVGPVVAALGLLGLLLLPTCPHCGLRLFPHAISSQGCLGLAALVVVRFYLPKVWLLG